MGLLRKLKKFLGLAADLKEFVEVFDVPFRPGVRPGAGGLFILFRGGEPVRDYQGEVVQCWCAEERRLPPGFVPGDVWRRVSE